MTRRLAPDQRSPIAAAPAAGWAEPASIANAFFVKQPISKQPQQIGDKRMNGTTNKTLQPSNRRTGQSLVEYTLVLALVVIVCIAAVTVLGTNTSAKIASVAAQLAK
jgi:Flp pilus assembly pilin Flp